MYCKPHPGPQAFQKFQQPSLKSGKREMPLAGVQAFFDTCFKARAPNLEEVYHNLAKPDGEFPIWKFLRLLVTVFYPNCKHNQVQDPGQKLTRPMAAAPMISFRKLPKSAKSFRGLIPKQTFDISKLKRVKILGKGGNCAAWLCKCAASPTAPPLALHCGYRSSHPFHCPPPPPTHHTHCPHLSNPCSLSPSLPFPSLPTSLYLPMSPYPSPPALPRVYVVHVVFVVAK